MNYKMILQYDGTRYDGWQRQGNTDRTIQGKLEAVLGRMAGEAVEVHGSGRTDGGVHARGQVANFHLAGAGKPEDIRAYLNRYLPEDICVLELTQAPQRFHSRLNACQKTYRYQVWLDGKTDVFQRDFFYGLGQQLDVEQMKRAAGILLGTHDFKSFCGNKKMKKSTVRTISSIHFIRLCEGRALAMDFTGNGFLQQMVRILAGTLIEVGQGKRKADSLGEVLEGKERSAAGFTAPPEGLCLMSVQYEEEI